jgi:hypothetical protein
MAWQSVRHPEVTMDQDILRLIIRGKLADGRLPLNRMPKLWGGPGNGESCDACDSIVTKDEGVIEAQAPLAVGTQPLQLHARCFWLWEAERRPQVASDDLATAPVMASAPGRRASPSIISGQMNGYGVTRGYDEA